MKRILFLSQPQAVSSSPNYNAYFLDYESRIDAVYPEPYRTYFNNFFQSLDDAGIIQELDYLRVYSNISRDAAITNMASSSFKATEVGSPTWSQYIGYTWGIGQYLDSNYNPSTDAVNWTADNCFMGIYSRTNANISAVTIGAGVAAPSICTIYPRYVGLFIGNINSAAVSTSVADSLGGFYIRANSNTVYLYKNSALIDSFLQVAVSSPNLNIYEGCRNDGGATDFDMRNGTYCAVGSGNVNISTLHSIVSTLMTDLGINV